MVRALCRFDINLVQAMAPIWRQWFTSDSGLSLLTIPAVSALALGGGGLGGVETRRLRRERETVGEKVCSQHPARETLTLDRLGARAATMPASPAPTHLASQAEQKAKMQNYKNTKNANQGQEY